jgi:hypothetical protein
MANFQALLSTTQLPLDGVAGRVRPHLIIAKGERGKLLEISTRKYQIVPRLEGLKKVRKLGSHWHLRAVFPPPEGGGTEIHAAVGRMKEFMRLKSGDVRTPAEGRSAIKHPSRLRRGYFPRELVRRLRERMHGFTKEPRGGKIYERTQRVSGGCFCIIASGIWSWSKK